MQRGFKKGLGLTSCLCLMIAGLAARPAEAPGYTPG